MNNTSGDMPAENQLRRTSSNSSDRSSSLRYGAKNVIHLFIPVTICMVIVVGTIKLTDSYQYSSQSIISYANYMYTDQSVDTGTRVWQSFANALIMLVFIVALTTVLILLYKFRFYKTIHAWLILSSTILLFVFAINYVGEILKVYNIPLDYITLGVFIWNFGIVGIACIHWKGPLVLQQAYLITISALMALTFIKMLPDWTIWTVLVMASVWDLVAVLSPIGPLRILVELSQKRNEPIFPALIYSSMMIWEVGAAVLTKTLVLSRLSIGMAENRDSNSNQMRTNSKNKRRENRNEAETNQQQQPSSSRRRRSGEIKSTPVKRNQHPVEIHYEDGAQPPEVAFIVPGDEQYVRLNASTSRNPRSSNIDDNDVERGTEALPTRDSMHPHMGNHHHLIHAEEEEESGVKLGLGDFIFYSVLVGKASSYGDWTITLSCYVSILVGLSLTLSLLAVFKKALPALPISIAFGVSFFFLSYVFIVPFAEILATNQIFI